MYFHCISITLKLLQNHNYNYMTSCIGVLMLHITFSKYDCIIVHKAYYVLTCTCVLINSFHSHSHSHIITCLSLVHNILPKWVHVSRYGITLPSRIYTFISLLLVQVLVLKHNS